MPVLEWFGSAAAAAAAATVGEPQPQHIQFYARWTVEELCGNVNFDLIDFNCEFI